MTRLQTDILLYVFKIKLAQESSVYFEIADSDHKQYLCHGIRTASFFKILNANLSVVSKLAYVSNFNH